MVLYALNHNNKMFCWDDHRIMAPSIPLHSARFTGATGFEAIVVGPHGGKAETCRLGGCGDLFFFVPSGIKMFYGTL